MADDLEKDVKTVLFDSPKGSYTSLCLPLVIFGLILFIYLPKLIFKNLFSKKE